MYELVCNGARASASELAWIFVHLLFYVFACVCVYMPMIFCIEADFVSVHWEHTGAPGKQQK